MRVSIAVALLLGDVVSSSSSSLSPSPSKHSSITSTGSFHSSEAVFSAFAENAPREMRPFLEAFKAEILAPTAEEMRANAERAGLAAWLRLKSEDIYAAVPKESGSRNPLCYQFPNSTYADYVMAQDPLLKKHDLVHDSCLNNGFATYVRNDPVFTDAELYEAESTRAASASSSDCLPIVQMHGMGDFALNPAYRRLGQDVSEALTGDKKECYLLTPQLGSSVMEDIIGGFLRPLEPSVRYFAETVKNDSTVAAAGAFNAIGYSQGNLIIRGYAELYAGRDGYPAVQHHMSMFGMHMGVAGFPGCNMSAFAVCRELAELLGELAYLPVIQAHLMQANYFRAPTNLSAFRAGDAGLAQLNNEQAASNPDQTGGGELRVDDRGAGSGYTGNLTLVKGLADTTVQPNDSSWYGYYKDGATGEGGSADIVQMEDAPWFTEDWFGLPSLAAAGQVGFETVPGAHMQFDEEDLVGFVNKYWAT